MNCVTSVNYTNPDCEIGSLATRRIYYEIMHNMDITTYDDPDGYYIASQECCRNGIIDNITDPGGTGQTFYLEFPKLSIENSSPGQFKPIGDYACINQDFTFFFGGIDPDGDELKYSLTNPLSSDSNIGGGTSVVSPAPYDSVEFIAGIGVNNMILGNPPLTISEDGFLHVRPTQQGLYVFAVLCEEFRDGIKIGEVHREFQLLVIECEPASPPELEMRVGTNQQLYQEGTLLTYNESDAKCELLRITDKDPNTEITITINPINFVDGVTVNPTQGTINGQGDVLNADLCFPTCPNANDVPYIFDVIAADNSCSLPLYDTLRVQAKVIGNSTIPVNISTSLNFNTNLGCYQAIIKENETLNFDVFGEGSSNDILEITGEGLESDMSFQTTNGKPRLVAPFSWTPPCNYLGDNQNSKIINLRFLLSNFNTSTQCTVPPLNTETCVQIIVEKASEQNVLPQISMPLTYDAINQVYFDTLEVNDLENFIIEINDQDGDSLVLELTGHNFSMNALVMTYSPRSGIAQLNSEFNWKVLCEHLSNPNDTSVFLINGLIKEFGFCKEDNQSSISIRLVVLPKTNSKPSIQTNNLAYDAVQNVYFDTLTLGENLSFSLLGDDVDKDTINIKAYPEGFTFADLEIEFDDVRGFPTQNTEFSWQTTCDLANQLNLNSPLYINFIVNDENTCGQNKTDTLRVRLVLRKSDKIHTKPHISTSLFFDTSLGMYVDSIGVLDEVSFDVFVNNNTQDSLFLTGEGVGFDLEDLDMQFSNTLGFPPLKSTFTWNTTCEHLAKGDKTKNYIVQFIGNSYLNCNQTKFDTIQVKIVVVPKVNTPPKIEVGSLIFDTNSQVYCDTVGLDETINFDILGEDLEHDNISISAYGVGFELEDLGMNFIPADGLSPQTANFDWTTNCQMLSSTADDTVYYVNFVVEELREDCLVPLKDSIKVKVLLLRKENRLPLVSTTLEFDAINNMYVGIVNVNDEITFDAIGEDLDNEPVSIDTKGLGVGLMDLGFDFTPVTGDSPQRMSISWTPTCDFLGQNAEKSIELEVRVSDIPFCNDSSFETAKVKITVKDYASAGDFLPVNVFTPNDDGKNDTFSIPNLPVDGCRDSFKSITIFNRWGKEVFQSEDRNFEWPGGKFPSGVYFYVINYISGDFSGSVSLIRNK